MMREQMGHFKAPHDATTQQALRVTWGIDAYTITPQTITAKTRVGAHSQPTSTTAIQIG